MTLFNLSFYLPIYLFHYLSPHPASIQHHYPVVVSDGVESVCDGEYGAALEGLPDGGLDEVIRLHIHGCCRLIQQQDLDEGR